MITVNGEEAEIEVDGKEVYVGGYWLAEFACPSDATTFVDKVNEEGRAYNVINTNKLEIA
jgi:hypothetical protein